MFLLFFLLPIQAHLLLQPPHIDRYPKLKYGQSVALPLPTRLLIGANGYDNFRGAVYQYDQNGAGTRPEHWRLTKLESNVTQQAEEKKPRELRVVSRGSGLGFSVSGGKGCVVSGAPGHELQRGMAVVFREGGEENLMGERGGDLFGWSVAVDEICEWVVVGAKGRRGNNGGVYVYRCTEKCEFVNRFEPEEWTDAKGPRGVRIRNNFGVSLAISRDGRWIVAGCTGFDGERGVVYVYERDGEWKLKQKLEGKSKWSFFGYKVAVDASGESIVVGADGEEGYKGRVYVYEREDKFVLKRELVAETRREEDNFGGSVAVEEGGVVVGGPGRGGDVGSVFVFGEGGEVRGLDLGVAKGGLLGWDVAVGGGMFLAAAPFVGSGCVLVGKVEDVGHVGDKDEL